MATIRNFVQKSPLITFSVGFILIVALAGVAAYSQIMAWTASAKLAALTENIDRAAFASRCGVPPAIRLAGGVVSFAGRLMHEEDLARLVAHHKPGSVRYYYRLPSDTSEGTLVNELPNCPLYREQYLY